MLMEINRTKLKKIFAHHSCLNAMNITEFTKFCKNSRVFPDLLTILELKRICLKVANAGMMTYQNFE